MGTGVTRRCAVIGATALAILLGAGCGTRLDDTQIVEAASRPVVVSGSAVDAPAAGAGAAIAPSDAGGMPAAQRGVAADVTPTIGAAQDQASAGSGTVNPGPAAAPDSSGQPAGARSKPATVPTKSTVVIGNIGDYSGVVGSVLKAGGPTAQVVARFINDNGGLNGHPVQILTADAGGDPSRALSIVRDLVENKGATAFLGNMWVLSGSGARAYLEQKQIPVIGGDVTTALWFQSPMFFPQGSSFPTMAVGSLKTLADLGLKKVALVACAEVEACRIYRDAGAARAASVGATVVYSAQVSLAQPDYTAECLQAKNSGAEALMLGIDSTALTRFARSCFQQGYKPQIVTASLATIASTTQDKNLEGLYSPVATFPYVAKDRPAAREYQAAIARYAPGLEQGPATSAVWTAGALLRLVGKALPDRPTSADFLKALWQVRGETLGGLAPPLTFRQGQPAPDITCYFLQRISGGAYTAPVGTKQTCL